MKPTKGKEKQTTATPEIDKEVDAEAVVKAEADAVADAERAREATKPTGRVRSTKPAGPIHSRCTLHENSNHTWGDCSKNPNSANYRPNGQGRGGGRGGAGRGGGGRGGGGGRYNNDRGNYYQGDHHQPRRDQYNNQNQQRDNYSIEEARRIVSEVGPGPLRLPPNPNNNNNDGYYNYYQNQRY